MIENPFDIKDGHYIVNEIRHSKVQIGTQIVNSDLLKKFLALGAISFENIEYYAEPIGHLKPEFWHQYGEIFYNIVEPTDKTAIKRMINFYVGTLGSIKSSKERAFLSTDINVLLTMIEEKQINKYIDNDGLYVGFS